MKAWRVTEASEAERLLRDGMNPGSFWATIPELADYYAEDYADPAILEIETDGLDPAALGFRPDGPSIAEPITCAIGKRERDVIREWRAVPGDGTWLDSVRVVGSFQVAGALPPSALRLRDGASPKPGM